MIPAPSVVVAVDAAAEPDDLVEVEIQHETGKPGRFKLYVSVNGVTLLRICKLTIHQIRNVQEF